MSIARERINTTLQVNISVKTGDEDVSLEGRDISVILRDPRRTPFRISDFSISGENENVISFVYQGRDQRYPGLYTVEIYENYMQDDMSSLDMDGFVLTPRTKGTVSSSGIASAVISLTAGNISITGKDGKSAYEVAVAAGYSGTIAEWLESLKAYTFDTAPTEDSTNPVTSGGVYTMVNEAIDGLVQLESTTYNDF